MNKDEIVEEVVNQPWLNVIGIVVLLSIGEATGFFLGWLLFS